MDRTHQCSNQVSIGPLTWFDLGQNFTCAVEPSEDSDGGVFSIRYDWMRDVQYLDERGSALGEFALDESDFVEKRNLSLKDARRFCSVFVSGFLSDNNDLSNSKTLMRMLINWTTSGSRSFQLCKAGLGKVLHKVILRSFS